MYNNIWWLGGSGCCALRYVSILRYEYCIDMTARLLTVFRHPTKTNTHRALQKHPKDVCQNPQGSSKGCKIPPGGTGMGQGRSRE